MGVDPFATEPVTDLQVFKGVPYPVGVGYRRLLVTGPPGAGKSHHIARIHGWPEEGYVDLSQPHWWTARALAMRPREVHLGFPFDGFETALAVFDHEWIEANPHPLPNLERILIPPARRYFFSTDWRGRFVVEFLLPPAEHVFAWRQRRAREGTHPVDEDLAPELVEDQLRVFRHGALHLHLAGMTVIVREGSESPPLRFCAGQHHV